MIEKDSGDISIPDAVRLKHEINKSIKYAGYNAKEIEELERVNKEQVARFGEGLSLIKKSWWFFPDWVMATGFVIAGLSLFYFESSSIRVFCLIAMTYCATQVAYRLGVYYGLSRGFQDGHVEGVRRVLGISPADASEIGERATEMEMDDMLVKELDRHKD